MATQSSTLTWKIPWTEKCSRLQSMGPQRVWHDWATKHKCTRVVEVQKKTGRVRVIPRRGEGETEQKAMDGYTGNYDTCSNTLLTFPQIMYLNIKYLSIFFNGLGWVYGYLLCNLTTMYKVKMSWVANPKSSTFLSIFLRTHFHVLIFVRLMGERCVTHNAVIEVTVKDSEFQ